MRKMPHRLRYLPAVVLLILVPLLPTAEGKNTKSSSRGGAAAVYFEPRFRAGQVLGNVFSRTIAFKAEGVEIAVRRISGTATYTVIQSSTNKLLLDGVFLYDGRPETKAKTEMRDQGRTVCYDDKCAASTDASGLLFNARIWGEPSGTMRKGMSWEVSIDDAWELGPPGKQTVTVTSVDQANHSITVRREGKGEGFFADEKKQIPVTKDGKTYTVDVVPGSAHWNGYTTFREGVVISDELLVERSVTLSSTELGRIPAVERQYILLNAMPQESR